MYRNSHLASERFCSLAVTCKSMSRRVSLSFSRQTKTVSLYSLIVTFTSLNDICTAVNKMKIILLYSSNIRGVIF